MTSNDLKKIVAKFNSVQSWIEFLVMLDLLDIKLSDFEKEYTAKVASTYPAFLDKFLDKKTNVFSLKKFFDFHVPGSARPSNAVVNARPLLPWKIKIENDQSRLNVRFMVCTDRSAPKTYCCSYNYANEMVESSAYVIDVQTELLNIILFEIARG